MNNPKKFKTNIGFESFDEAGNFEPIKVPDFKPYLDANRAAEQRDIQTHMDLGLKDLKNQQDRTAGVEAYNAVVQQYIAESGLANAKHLSKSLEGIVNAGIKIYDQQARNNAAIDFDKALRDGEVAPIQAILEFNALSDGEKVKSERIRAIAGKYHQLRELDDDNLQKLFNLDAWRQGPYRMQLMMKHYGNQVKGLLDGNSNVPITLEEFPGQQFTLDNPDAWPEGHSFKIRAALEEANIAQIVKQFAGFPEELIGQHITPQIIKWQEGNDVNFADDVKTRREGTINQEMGFALSVAYGSSDSRDLYKTVQEQFKDLSHFYGPQQAKLAIFQQLMSDAKAGLLSNAKARELLDTVMDPKSKKQQTYREFLGERFLAEYDLEYEADKAAVDKIGTRERALGAHKTQLKHDVLNYVAQYKKDNHGAFPPATDLQGLVEKWEKTYNRSGWDVLTGILHAENVDDNQVKANLEYLRKRQGGKLTEDQIRYASPDVQTYFIDKGQVTASELKVNFDTVKADKGIIEGYVNDHITSTSPWAPGALKKQTIESAQTDYVFLYQKNLDGGMPHHQASEDAKARVQKLITDNKYRLAERQFGSSVAKSNAVREEFQQNGYDYAIPIRSLEADVAQMVNLYEATGGEKNGKLDIPLSIQRFANMAKITPQEAAVYQSRGKIKLPGVEYNLNQKIGKNNLITIKGTNQRVVRTNVDNPGILVDLQKPEYKGGEYDAKDNKGTVVKIDVESLTIAEVMNQLERGKIKTATGYEFTYLELVNAWADADLNPDSLMTPQIQEILYQHKLTPGAHPHVEPSEEVSFWNSNFLWRTA